ncbi:sensor histidine kinase [Paenibacillus sp. 32O-W]|uniref:sensor histidine kinase n=1 Tax=Paenibacillus sp. 32O-W TaxID=1695218 RepID=UPI001C92D533|nr:sensor histidine kinase [Paenibacillus sp. 32O-W]
MMKLDQNEKEEVFITTADFEELPINAMARVVIQLGEQLIENEVVALLEIIKNSYDADAKHVFIEINTLTLTNRGQGYIKITDNGNGMNREQISNGFLLISTINKTEKLRSIRHDRVPLGEKGVGRLSTQRLASFLNLRTKGWKHNYEYLLSIDWSRFNENVTLGSVSAQLNTNEINIKNMKDFDDIHIKSYVPKQVDDGDFGFTQLNLLGLNNISFWNQEGIDKILGNEVLRLVSPFKKNDSIDITIELTNEHVSNKIIKTEAIDEDFLENASMYKIKFDFNYPFLTMDYSFKPMFYKKLEGKEPRKNLPRNYEENHIPISDKSKVINILEDNDKLRRILKKSILENKVDFANPGKFHGVLFNYNYAVEQQLNEFYTALAREVPNLFENDKEVKEFLKSNAGVKIYRDKFRVLPYGNEESDWLGLTKISQSAGSYLAPKVANTIGYVEINSLDNAQLKEMTNRQGFILDAYGENFLAICREVAFLVYREVRRQADEFGKQYPRISAPNAHEEANEIISKTSLDVKDMLSQTKKIASKLTEEKYKNQLSLFDAEEKEEIINQAGESLIKIVEKTINITSNLEKASEEIKAAKRLYEYSQEEMAPLLELSALGIIAEALTHEMNKSITNTRFRAQSIQKYMVSGLKDANNEKIMELLKKSHGEARLIEAESNSIDRQVRHLAPGFRKRRRTNEKVNLNKELNNIYKQGVIAERAERNGIEIRLIQDAEVIVESSLGLVIQVFDNLYINSEYWLQYFYVAKEIDKKVFNIQLTSKGLVRVWDSGLGIDPIIEDRLFLPFETQKNEGRGLGLYIVSSILEISGSTIRLLPEKNMHNRRFIFEIDFSKAML